MESFSSTLSYECEEEGIIIKTETPRPSNTRDPRIRFAIEFATADIQKEKENLESKLAKLQEKHQKESEKSRQLVLENGRLRESIKEWKSHSNGKKAQVEDLKGKLQKAQEELNSIGDNNGEKDQEIDKWRQSTLQQMKKTYEWDERVTQLENTVKVVNAELSNARENAAMMDKVNAETIRSLEAELKQNRNEMIVAKKIAEGHVVFLEIRNAKIKELESQLKHSQQGISLLLFSEKDKQLKINALESDLEKAKCELDETVDRYKLAIQSLKNEGTLHKKFEQDIKFIVKWPDENDDDNLEVRLEKLRHYVKEYLSKITESEEEMEKAKLLKKKAEKIIANQESFLLKMKEKDAKVKSLTESLENFQRKLASSIEKQINLHRSVEEKDVQINALESQLKSTAEIVIDMENAIHTMIATDKCKDMEIGTLHNELQKVKSEREEAVNQFNWAIQLRAKETMEKLSYGKFVEEIQGIVKWKEDEGNGGDDNLEARLGKLLSHVKKFGAMCDYLNTKVKAKKRPPETQEQTIHEDLLTDDNRAPSPNTSHENNIVNSVSKKKAKPSGNSVGVDVEEKAQDQEQNSILLVETCPGSDDEGELVDIESLF